MITVQQLLEALQDCDKSKIVVFDHDGVSFPVTAVYTNNWVYNEKIEIALPIELTPELEEKLGICEDDLDDGTGLPCILLTDD